MPTSQQLIQRTEIENQIKNDFFKLQKNLESLKNEVQTEIDDTKKQEKVEEIQRLETESEEMKKMIDTLSSLQEQDLESLKIRLESFKAAIQNFKWEVADLQNEKLPTETTYELLKHSETYNRLLNIISSNPNSFKFLKKDDKWNELDTPEKKLEHIFKKVRDSIVLFIKNKIWKSEKYDQVINCTIVPAFEWSLMELLCENWNEKNVGLLEWIDKISRDSFESLVNGFKNLEEKTKWSFDKFTQWVNAIDYLSLHNWVLNDPWKSAVLTSPVEFKNYLNDPIFAPKDVEGQYIGFSPYEQIDKNIFKIDENQNFEFGISLQEKQDILNQIWNIQIVNNPKTASLIGKMLNKSENILKASTWLQNIAYSLLDWANAFNSITKLIWIDLLWEINKPMEQRWIGYRIIDFIFKLIWITWWLEWLVKKWRLDRLKLTGEKNGNITEIFEEYQNLAWKWSDISIIDVNSCSSVLADFALTDLDNQSTTKWDYLRDVMADKMEISFIPTSVIQQTLWNEYLKKETVMVNWKQKENTVVDASKITEEKKRELAHLHIGNMKKHLEENYDDLIDFYANIHNTDDLVICMTTSLYADKEDVIEWIKAKVFLPKNYGVTYGRSENGDNEWQDDWWDSNEWNNEWRNNLDSTETSDKQRVSEQWMYDKIVEFWVSDKRKIAYILATAKLETSRDKPWFKNIEEFWKWKGKPYWNVDAETWKIYYGRWFVQLTWKGNYKKYTQIIKERGEDFKDNEGKTLKCSDIDLVKDPDTILRSNDLAAFILVHWMENWIFTWKKLDNFINETKTDFVGARQIVNGNNLAQKWANYAQSYLDTLTA